MPALSFLLTCVVLMVLQFLAAAPWLATVDVRLRDRLRNLQSWLFAAAVAAGCGIGAALYLQQKASSDFLAFAGRAYMSVLHLQLAVDFFVFAFLLMLTVWPKGGAVSLAAFREGVRQPMFWMLAGFGALLMIISPFVPYFTFGEDLKMVKELCYAFTMMMAAIFGVVGAGMSVHEEIEGRTAVTLMSKPISRRDFLLGKFAGTFLACLSMILMLGWVLVWVVLFKEKWEEQPRNPNEVIPDPAWIVRSVNALWESGNSADLGRGIFFWINDAGAALPGLILSACQVMVLVASTVALATRLPMVLSFPLVLVIYFLGHLTPIMTEVTRYQFALVHFMAQLFETILPALDLFDVGSSIIRDMPLPPADYALYTFNVALYAVTYTAIALLFGLILFEDRDLA